MKHESQIVLYQTEDGKTQIQVKLQEESVWLNQVQMAELFQRDKSTISEHIKNVFEEGELEKKRTVGKFPIVQMEGKPQVTRTVEFYNLDVIISVGYRVKSHRGTQFRIWATERLKEYIIKENEAVYYGALVNSWLNTRMEKDKSILTLSTGAIGLLITLLSAKGVVNCYQASFYFGALISFLTSDISILIILEKNAEHIEEVLRNPKTKQNLKKLDRCAFFSFVFGLIFSFLIGLSTIIKGFYLFK